MALPTVDRVWSYHVNDIRPGNINIPTQARNLWFTIKQALIGHSSISFTNRAGSPISSPIPGAWSVYGSCNSVSSSMGAGDDLWASETDLVWSATSTARSWIVFSALGSGGASVFHVLFHLNGAVSACTALNIAVSHTGYGVAYGGTDGSTTAPPTAVSATTVLSGEAGGSNTANTNSVLHVAISSLGVRIYICRNNVVAGLGLIEKIADPVTGWAAPYYSFWRGINSASPTTKLVSNSQLSGIGALGRGFGSSEFVAAITCEGFGSGYNPSVFTGVSSFTGEMPMFPLRVASTTAGNIGSHGRFQDIWLGLENQPTGTTFPATPAATREFVQLDNLIIPWNGTVPVISV